MRKFGATNRLLDHPKADALLEQWAPNIVARIREDHH